MRSGWEELGDASSLEASLGKTEGSSETGTASTDNNGVIFMINNSVVTNT